jgi:undecaprenyl-diphosphatase
MESLLDIDRWLFTIGNAGCTNSVFDGVFPILTSNAAMLPLYALALAVALWRDWRKGLLLLGLLLVAILVADQSIIIIKDLIGRERPCNAVHGVRLLVDCGTGKSFPSAHAANSFAAALLVGGVYPRLRAVMLVVAGLVAFSRVYCGVHYPFDISAGAVYGALIGWCVWQVYRWVHQRLSEK